MSLQTRARWFIPRSSNRGFFNPCSVLTLPSCLAAWLFNYFKPRNPTSLVDSPITLDRFSSDRHRRRNRPPPKDARPHRTKNSSRADPGSDSQSAPSLFVIPSPGWAFSEPSLGGWGGSSLLRPKSRIYPFHRRAGASAMTNTANACFIALTCSIGIGPGKAKTEIPPQSKEELHHETRRAITHSSRTQSDSGYKLGLGSSTIISPVRDSEDYSGSARAYRVRPDVLRRSEPTLFRRGSDQQGNRHYRRQRRFFLKSVRRQRPDRRQFCRPCLKCQLRPERPRRSIGSTEPAPALGRRRQKPRLGHRYKRSF